MIKKIATAILIFVPIVIMGAKNEDGSKVNRAKTIEIDIEDKTTEEDTTDKQLEALELMQLAETMVKNDDKANERDNNNYKKKEKIHMANRGVLKPVPKTGTSMKSYMDYKAISDISSEQYKLQHDKDIYTDNEGFRRVGDNFIIAVGTYFNCNVGQEVMVKLSSGITFKATIGDIKNNMHTDSENIQHNVDSSVVEFLVDSRKLEEIVRKMGDCSYSNVNDFKGDVVGITVYE